MFIWTNRHSVKLNFSRQVWNGMTFHSHNWQLLTFSNDVRNAVFSMVRGDTIKVNFSELDAFSLGHELFLVFHAALAACR